MKFRSIGLDVLTTGHAVIFLKTGLNNFRKQKLKYRNSHSSLSFEAHPSESKTPTGMAEKKSEHHGFGWAELLVEGIFGGIRSTIAGAMETAEHFVGKVTRKVAERLMFTFCALVGLIYVFSGLTEWIDSLYLFPGIGSFAVGGALLVIAFVLYLFSRNN